MSTIEIHVPDIGDFKDVPVIEVHVQPGDTVKVEDPLITLETDKATMEVPCPQAGTVGEVKVKAGDKVCEGDLILMLEAEGAAATRPRTVSGGRRPRPASRPATARRPASMRRSRSRSPTSATSRTSRSSRST